MRGRSSLLVIHHCGWLLLLIISPAVSDSDPQYCHDIALLQTQLSSLNKVDVDSDSIFPLDPNIHAKVIDLSILQGKRKNDPRHYQYAKLANGLQVVNVYDPNASTVALAVSVRAGAYDNPPDVLGLAHLCEHMLFLGTTRFPDPSEYSKFVSRHLGHKNAYTAAERTVYYLSVQKSGWNEALDRLSDFFREPLLSKEFVKKEVHAVESEHDKNIPNPEVRTKSVMLSLADPKSPVGWFHTGDASTLIREPKTKGLDPVEELKKFYKAHYCPSTMSLVTYSGSQLFSQLNDTLATFGDLPKGDCDLSPPGSISRPPAWHPANVAAADPSNMAQWIDIKANQPEAALWVMWALPPTRQLYKSHPLLYVKYCLAYQGDGSLVRALKEGTGLVTYVDVDVDTTSMDTKIWFKAGLTTFGREHPSSILDLLLAYITLMRSHGVDMALFKSLTDAEQISYEWRNAPEVVDVVKDLAAKMTWLPKDDLLAGEETTQEPSKELTSKLLKQITPQRMNVAFVDPQFKVPPGSELKKLPHYDIQYTLRLLKEVCREKEKHWAQWLLESNFSQAQKGLATHLKAEGLRIVKLEHVRPIPKLPDVTLSNKEIIFGKGTEMSVFGIRPTEVVTGGPGSLWFRQGTVSKSPKVYARFLLRAQRRPTAMTKREVLLLQVVERLKKLQIESKIADLTAIGHVYSFDTSSSRGRLLLDSAGFAETLPSFLTVVLKEIGKATSGETADQGRFEYVVEMLRDEFSTYNAMPSHYALHDRDIVLTKGIYSRKELLSALDTLKVEEVPRSFGRLVLAKPLQYTSFVFGNIHQAGAEELHQTCVRHLHLDNSVASLSLQDVEMHPPVVNLQSPVEIRKNNPRPGDKNYVMVFTLVQGIPNVRDRVLLSMLGRVFGQVAFQELRTQRQLGYVVHAGLTRISNVLAFTCVCQGTKKNPDEMEPIIEWVYTKKMVEVLGKMEDAEFQTLRQSFISVHKERPENFEQEYEHWSQQTDTGGNCFGLRDKLVEYAEHNVTSKQDLIDAWFRAVQPHGKADIRRKVTIKYFPGHPPDRPDASAAASILKALNVDDAVINLSSKEHASSLVFSDADSQARAKIIEDTEQKSGQRQGYFPEHFDCMDND